MSDRHNDYTIAHLIGDLLFIFVVLLICDMCGCSAFEEIGHSLGKITNAYRETTQQIHPSDFR